MKNRIRIIGIAILFLLCRNGMYSQMTIEDFFGGSNASELQLSEPSLSSELYKMPWIEEFDLRTETDDLDFERQEYTFRFSPNSLKKKRAQEQLLRLIDSAPNFRKAELICEEKITKYKDWLSLFLINEQQEIINKLEPILLDNEKIINRKSAALDFDFVDMVRLTERKADLQLAMLDIKTEQEIILSKNGMTEANFDFGDFISINKLIERVESIQFQNVENPKDNYEYELLQKELELELAEGRQIFDFGQVRYSGPHSDLIEERLSFGIGLNIPNSGNRKVKIRELELEQNEILFKNELASTRKSFSASIIKTELIQLITAYLERQEIIDQELKKLDQIAALASGKEGFDPMILIDIELKKLTRTEEDIKHKEKIYNTYLKYLEETQVACHSEVQYLTNE